LSYLLAGRLGALDLSVEPSLAAPEAPPLGVWPELPADEGAELELFAPVEPAVPAWLSRLQPASTSASDAARMVSSFIESSKPL
jgi:hypothetical protein